MVNFWSSVRRPASSHPEFANGSHARPEDPPIAVEEPRPVEGDLTVALDAVGRRSEAIRGRISNLHERLEDLTTLKDEFVAFVGPLADLITDFPEVQSKLHDAETMLQQLRETNGALGRDLQAVRTQNTRFTDQVAALTSANQDLLARIDDFEDNVGSLRLSFSDKEILAAELEKQLFAETEHGRALSDENQALRRETQEADQTVARLERTLAEAREQIELLEHDTNALQGNATEQTKRFAGLDEAYRTLAEQFQGLRQANTKLEEKLAAEQSQRAKLEAQIEAERSSHRAESARLELKVEGVMSRMNVTERILSHSRDELRQRTEELKVAERSAKEAVITKNTIERRLEAMQDEIARLTTRAVEAERAHFETTQRHDMLTKAVAEKDSTISKADHRIVMLLDRIDQLTSNFNNEREGLMAANAGLTAELQSEKSGRSLAQSALDAARQTRVEIDLLRHRGKRTGTDDSLVEVMRDDGAGGPALPLLEGQASNVRPFKSPSPD